MCVHIPMTSIPTPLHTPQTWPCILSTPGLLRERESGWLPSFSCGVPQSQSRDSLSRGWFTSSSPVLQGPGVNSSVCRAVRAKSTQFRWVQRFPVLFSRSFGAPPPDCRLEHSGNLSQVLT